MWVADMDLASPPFVIEALKTRLDHPILGYTQTPDATYEAINQWHSFDVPKESVLFTENVVSGLNKSVLAFSSEGEQVVIQPPVYYPFFSVVKHNNRILVESPLQLVNDQYVMDFDHLETVFKEEKTTLMLLSNPHNPSGRVWSKAELTQLANLANQHGVTIVSDEIHADLSFVDHTPMATMTDVITLNSPSKAFNIAALPTGYAIINDKQKRLAFKRVQQSVGTGELNLFASIAIQSAYSKEGQKWLKELRDYLRANIDHAMVRIHHELPTVKVLPLESTYLLWIDFSALFDDQDALNQWMIKEAKLGLNNGTMFGRNGKGFMRMNVAVPRKTLNIALDQLKEAYATRFK
jgi:cystathionine beta-lyase